MKSALRSALLALLCLVALSAAADVRVFEVNTPEPQQLLSHLQALYGDRIHAELVRERLVVSANKQELDEIERLLQRVDRAPSPLRLTLSEELPIESSSGTINYHTAGRTFQVDTVEGAQVALEYDKIVQQPRSNGWWVSVEDKPVRVKSMLLQVQLQGQRAVLVRISYSRQQNQRRRVYTNTLSGDLNTWLPLLPRPAPVAPGTITTPPKAGSQLYLRVEKLSR